jgi:hypothetical protein
VAKTGRLWKLGFCRDMSLDLGVLGVDLGVLALGNTIDLTQLKDNVFLGHFCIRHRANNSKDEEGKGER